MSSYLEPPAVIIPGTAFCHHTWNCLLSSYLEQPCSHHTWNCLLSSYLELPAVIIPGTACCHHTWNYPALIIPGTVCSHYTWNCLLPECSILQLHLPKCFSVSLLIVTLHLNRKEYLKNKSIYVYIVDYFLKFQNMGTCRVVARDKFSLSIFKKFNSIV